MNTTPTMKLAHELARNYIGNTQMGTVALYHLAKEFYGGPMASGVSDRSDMYNALELAFQIKVLSAHDSSRCFDLNVSEPDARKSYGHLRNWLHFLPTHTVRSSEQVEFQQFSTPPHLAYLAAWVACIDKGEQMLEPSAGLGSLATFGIVADAQLYVNELAQERHALLDSFLGSMEGVTLMPSSDAGNLRAFYPNLRPTVVLMNPPFSANGATGYKSKFIGLDHVKQGLSMLQTGGRMVAILYGGRNMPGDHGGASMSNPQYAKEWELIKSKFTIRANVGFPGSEYFKYGTAVNTRLIVIDKIGPQEGKHIVEHTFKNNEDIVTNFFPMMEPVRDVRHHAALWEYIAPTPLVVASEPGEQAFLAANPGHPVAQSLVVTKPEPETRYVEGNEPVHVLSPEARETLDKMYDEIVEVEELPAVEDIEAEEVAPDDNLLSVFQGYKPYLTLTGAKAHPSPLVESDTLRLVKPPKPKTRINLPFAAVRDGKISDVQIECVALAVNSASRLIPGTNIRRSFIAGQGTGFGKGTTLAAVIMHYWIGGVRRIFWVSKTGALLKDAKRDWTWIGGDEKDIFLHNDMNKSVIERSGIMFGTYSTIAMEQTATEQLSDVEGREKMKGVDRLEQIKAWKPELIIYDESHMCANSIGNDAAKMAVRSIKLMEAFPDVPVIMASATAATEVHNLAYATDRLGLCGPQMSAFPDKESFISKIGGAGMLAMELVAKDMKTMGLYMSQNLSYEGTSFRMLEHDLTQDQIEQYDTACVAWRLAIKSMEEAMKMNRSDRNGRVKALIKSQFYSAMQRFFNQLLTSMKTPAIIADMELMLAQGHSCVIQLVNTNEAATARAVAEAQHRGESLDEMDISPKDTLIQVIMSVFPTNLYEYSTDDKGVTTSVPVTDKDGNFVSNPDAIKERDYLIRRVSDLRIPEGCMDMIINHFGFDKVAEVTGRKERYVTKRARGSVGLGTKIRQSRTKMACNKEVEEFNEGLRRIIIFSAAGNTGRSFHADKRFKNQQRRIHYVAQAGWRADEALQGLGRTHRTNQKQPPEYVLATTSLRGEKRFITSIARRIEQLGSLTKGNRKAASGGLFSAEDNLETVYATQATYNFFVALQQNLVPGLSLEPVLEQMGLKGMLTETGGLSRDNMPKTTQFLNRLLCLNCDTQDAVFDAWFSFIHDLVEKAIANGTFDKGVEKLNAESVTKLSEVEVYTDKESGAVSRIVELQVKNRTRTVSIEEATSGRYVSDTVEGYSHVNIEKFYAYVKQTMKSGPNAGEERVFVVLNANYTTDKNGKMIRAFRKISPFYAEKLTEPDYMAEQNERIDEDTARALWAKAIAQARGFEYEDVYLLTGALLPIWDKIPPNRDTEARIIAAETVERERLLGRVIPAEDLHQLFINLGALKQGEYFTPQQLIAFVMEHDAKLVLSNNWKVMKRRTAGEDRLVVSGITSQAARILEDGGHMKYEFAGHSLYYIPLDENVLEHFQALTASRPVVQMDKQGYLVNVLVEPPKEQQVMKAYTQEAETYPIDHLIDLYDLKTMQLRPVTDLLLEALKVEEPVQEAAADLFSVASDKFALELPEPNLIPIKNLPVPKPAPVKAPVQVPSNEQQLEEMIQRAAYVHAHNPKPKKVKAMEAAGQMSLF